MDKEYREKTIKSTCGLCPIGCGIIAHMIGDQVVKIEGDPDHPLNKGILCPKGVASLEYLYHPKRLVSPLKRIGRKGAFQWRAISWDDALNEVAEKMQDTKETNGPESIAFIHGAAKGLQDSYLARLANILGTPNIVWQGHVCFVPRMLASVMTYGFYAIPDYENLPSCIVVWGKNTQATLHYAHQRIQWALEQGARLIVIDPRQTELAKAADLWLQVRPGTDLELALAMVSEIINTNLYDREFVYKWTIGFPEFRQDIQTFSLEEAEEITGVPAELIKRAAHMYALSKPACIQWGNSIDQGVTNFQTARALCILRSLTGNIGVPGGEIHPGPIPLYGRRSPQLELWDELPGPQRDKGLGTHSKLPMIRHVAPQNIIKAIIEEDPYPLHTLFIQGANPLLSYPNARKVYDALMKIDFLVVSDMFMTPTAALADIVLPVTCYLEFDSVVTSPYSYPVASVQQRITRRHEVRSDYEILSGIARKLGLDNYFWPTEEDCLDYVLKPSGITFNELRRIGSISGLRHYRDSMTQGFSTPSGKIEITSTRLKEWGFSPWPTSRATKASDKKARQTKEEYPYILTSWKSAPFRHSGGRQITSLRGMHPEPLVLIHPDTAHREGLQDGEWIHIETEKGVVRQKTHVTTGILPEVLGLDYAWWFPEKTKESLFGWAESNINISIDDQPPFSPETEATHLRGIPCKVRKE
jgi:anaerobic selenocysteine-containing dehydrogenase